MRNTVVSDDLITCIRQAAEHLVPIWPPPTEIDVRTREAADAAVDGVLMSPFDSTARWTLGRKGIDWAGHPGIGVLGRMVFIGELASAYHVLHAERYAEAARDYISDWMTFWTSE